MVNTNQPVGAYWIQLRGLGECADKKIQQLAILHYKRGPVHPITPPPTNDLGLQPGIVNFPSVFLIFLN